MFIVYLYFLYFAATLIFFSLVKSTIDYTQCKLLNRKKHSNNNNNKHIYKELVKTKDELLQEKQQEKQQQHPYQLKKENRLSLNNTSKNRINTIEATKPILNNLGNSINNALVSKNNTAQQQMDLTKGKAFIEEGKVCDEKREYRSALLYYTDGLEKLLPLCRVNKELRDYVDFYMGRAEHLKEELKKLQPEIIDYYRYLLQEQNIKQQLIQKQQQEQEFQNKQIQQQQKQQQQQHQQQMNSISSKLSNLFTIFSSQPKQQQQQEVIDVDRNEISYINKPKTPTTTTTTTTTPLASYKPQQVNKPVLNKSISTSTTPTNTPPKNNNNVVLRKPLTGSLTNIGGGGGGNIPSTTNIPDIKGIDKPSLTIIMNEIVDRTQPITWNDVVGLEKVKQSLNESVILPNLRPDVFKGLRAPPKGLLLFGPPGNGKTMIAKACANESKVTFFSISASSLTSKYVGESEKLVRALFAAASYYQPSIIFIDEIDSILNERNSQETEASRRLKTEILIQFDGVKSSGTDRVLVIGATNRPDDLDDAALRRLVKRIYVGLPEKEARLSIIKHLLKDQHHTLTPSQFDSLADATAGYSGFDLTALCKDAAYEPIRQLGHEIIDLSLNQIRPISIKDFRSSLKQIRPSVSQESLRVYDDWNSQYGTL